MNRCPQCHRGLPDDAAFCIYCAAQLRPAPQIKPHKPATGATIRLNPLEIDAPIQQAQPKSKQPSRPKHQKHHGHHRRHKHHGGRYRDILLGPIFCVGMVFLFMTNTWFPGIFVLFWLLSFIRAAMHGRSRKAMQHLIFLGGLVLLIKSGMFFPGIFLLMFATHMMSRSRPSWQP